MMRRLAAALLITLGVLAVGGGTAGAMTHNAPAPEMTYNTSGPEMTHN